MKYFVLFIIIATTLLSFYSCSEKKSTESIVAIEQDLPLPSWARDATIYEVNLRHYTPEGTFKAFENHLDRLKAMGVDVLWFMPIHPISMVNRKARGDLMVHDIKSEEERKKYLGSPYSVADYKKVNPDLGTDEDFLSLVQAIHQKGMKIIIDWVPNHTGWDHPWITQHPDWYTQDKDGNIIDPIDYNTGKSWGWTDVADLNYDNQDMRKAMISDMLYWINKFDIDGFRVDVAHGIPNDFWDQTKSSFLTLEKPIFLLAESEVPYHRNSGAFHTTYGWSFHHLMNDIAKGEKNANDVRKWMAQDSKNYNKGFHMHFTSNHDENSWAGTEFDRMGDAHKALAVLSFTMPGMPLIYSGQEEPLTKKLEFFTKDLIPFRRYAYADFYKRLAKFKEENRALHNDVGYDHLTHISKDPNVIAFVRSKNNDKVLTIINLSPNEKKIDLDLEFVKWENILTGNRKTYMKENKLNLLPWQALVLKGRR